MIVVGIGTGAYLAYAAATWIRYRSQDRQGGDHCTPEGLLESFMPTYEVREHCAARIIAPANTTFETACDADLMKSRFVRAIFTARAFIIGGNLGRLEPAIALRKTMEEIGWRVLAEVPNQEIVFGSVTRPWEAHVTFRPVAPKEFRSFQEPGYVKIAWNIRVEPVCSTTAVLSTETRVTTTDSGARKKFRWYWSFFSPGIILIRHVLLKQAKKDAERRAQ